MPAINFAPQFSEAILDGTKKQTIRPPRKHPIKPGDTLYLYTGLRTHNPRKLAAQTCTTTQPIQILPSSYRIYLSNRLLSLQAAKRLATRDGFKTLTDFYAWFRTKYGTNFRGVLICW